ncbi:phosphoadenosine phosphosulfate reductase family protein [Peribacillus asahii]|uniref:phosphoadenosine phosphosulfate reductase family protein n=1 Tax=Peribacillus asahii TaxID=228899 RepID=UPI00207969BA|nr:phosphoadenosine phosphosulfate reductase family protein [Peribacillus asahii]USK62349.1 phosphoadenosine phosphosulfate reductase family protein [Peribacillus asahii]
MINREIEADILMDWIFNGEAKTRQFNDIIEHMKVVYLSDRKPWIIAVSFGKDSALLLYLVWIMLESLTPKERHKTVYVLSADTKVETPYMSEYVKRNLQAVEEKGKSLGIVTKLVIPTISQSFFYKVIGKGLGAPMGNSRFSWCQFNLKQFPMNAAIENILAQQPFSLEMDAYEATLLAGTRLDESARRAGKIRKYEDQDYFNKHATFPTIRMYLPVRDISTLDLWNYLDCVVQVFPWGEPVQALREMYEDGKECPMLQISASQSCGASNSRNGCYVCLMGGRDDKMLQTLIHKGKTEAIYLAEWKAYLYDVSNDIRFREPLRRKEFKRHLENEKEPAEYPSLFGEEDSLYTSFERAYKGNEDGEYRPGGFAASMRKRLLEKLLYAQEKVGYELIEQEEISAILAAWEEDGFHVERNELKPINHQVDQKLIFKPDWSINEKESTIVSPVFFVEEYFRYGAAEMVSYYKERQRVTQESIFCYFDHFDDKEKRLNWNKAVFIVSRPDIWTQEEADKYVNHWLYLQGETTIGVDGKPYERMIGRSREATLKHLMLSAISESLNKTNEVVHI